MADLINHTARWVAMNGVEFGEMLAAGDSQKFSFVGQEATLPAAYYKNRLRFELEVLSAEEAAAVRGPSPEEHMPKMDASISDFHDIEAVEAQAAAAVSEEGLGGKLEQDRGGAAEPPSPDETTRKTRSVFGGGRKARVSR